MRVLGLDVGMKRIGVALSDPTGLLATPLLIIQHTTLQADFDAILKLARDNDVERILVGIPVSLDGALHHQAHIIQAFRDKLASQTTLPIDTWDERFSTMEAKERMEEAGIKPARWKSLLDAAAAAIVLQAYLDSKRSSQPPQTREL